MELTDSSELTSRSPLGIDLNEIPSTSSPPSIAVSISVSEHVRTPAPTQPVLPNPEPLELESLDVVRSFHENQDPPCGIAAGLPGEEGLPTCGACGKPEVRGHVVVCDGCERGFHISCAGMHGRQAMNLVDWICGECVSGGVKSKRWPLGVKSKRILDINASPPSDCDGDGESSEERVNLRKHTLVGNSSSGDAFVAPVAYSKLLYAGNGFGPFDFKKGSGLMMKAFRVGFEDILHHAQTVDRSLEEIDLGFPLGRLRSSNNTAIRLPSRSPNEILLQGLREFISERHGLLDEGWRVELKHSIANYEVYAVYCSPDGKTFGSMSEVACYLGLTPNCNSMDADNRSDGSPLPERLRLPKRRKSKRSSLANGFTENKQALVNGYHKELLSNGQSTEIGDSRFGKVGEADAEEDDMAKSLPSNEGLPIQFEDFFVISLGKIDLRPSYHDAQLIWPIGYRSCWHDKVTGSLFVCEVLDGGDSGPVFKVRRFSCSVLPVPEGSTVLCRKSPGQFDGQKSKEYNGMIGQNMDCDDDGTIEMILADASPPTEDDILTCLDSSSNVTYSVQTLERLQTISPHSSAADLSSHNLVLGDEIGEISAEECSSSLAWRMVSQKLIDAYSEICYRKGILKLYCKHVNNEIGSLTSNDGKESLENFASLAKFCSSPGSFGVPLEYEGKVDNLAVALSKWLDQDRFGLDTDFVQEIIEQLPGVDACSKYEFLFNRNDYSESQTVGNGILIAKRKNEAELDDVLRRCKKPRLGKDCERVDHYPPPGRWLCSKLPPVLVGDLYQVWELLWRFHEILGLKEPLLLGELEEELINPWFDVSNVSANLKKKVPGSEIVDVDKVDGMNGPILSSCEELCEGIQGDNSHVLIQVEKGGTDDSAQDTLASFSYSRFSGVALTKVHISLLSVLITELQSKVSALVDPNFDFGESKSKRGRRKDVDNLIPLRNKLSTLPINELTWPELARRYILAVLSMDGSLDSADITARESSKIFRCLQGDGGVLCGSLAGVAGMEADALLLAEATRKICGSLNREKDLLTIEDEATNASGTFCEKTSVNDDNIPEWAQVLEPVRKLPTNVGTRIRKCVYEALEKCPPEWAKKRLEHSISKEVYKGNASGPTKKAVLSVLADLMSEELPQKSEKRNKRKITLSVSDIIMKKCRAVLRQAAAADDSKVFCTLLGRNLINTSDHDDEGLLGSPAMVSRPLDFRTIDLRLAVGAYGGSHESFLEDVRELWNNVRTAFRDQPDLVELAETLSQNFETLYEKEVVTVVQKFEDYAKLDQLSAEEKKNLDDVLASTNEIPKAPWDDGVCKVCGVDKDDDSVLLCDTCDAEYHTYCLNPPLARIPEGNWYCPSCVGNNVVREASVSSEVLGQSHIKKYQGQITHAYLETLMHLAVAMGEKDYWQFGIDERTFLLKFLCDELLNSALVRQHLEQCVETTTELQQKLRSLSVELKNLKSREEFLAARTSKLDTSASGEGGEELGSASTNQSNCMGKLPNLSERPNHFCACSDDVPAIDDSQEGTGISGFDKHHSVMNYGKKHNCDSQTVKPVDAKCRVKDVDMDGCNRPYQENNRSSRPSELPLSNHLQLVTEHTGEICHHNNMQEHVGRNSSTPLDQPGPSLSSDMNIQGVENVPSVALKESQAYCPESSTIKDDILHLQNLITSIESQLLKQAMRREFLGSDSIGRLYWASATPAGHARVVADGSLTLRLRKISDHRGLSDNVSIFKHSASLGMNTFLDSEGSRACFPFMFNPNDSIPTCLPLVSYETDSEIEELIGWLGDNDQMERELKESIIQWLKLRFHETQQTRNTVQEERQAALSIVMNNDKSPFSNCLVTKAALFLEKKYGACVERETINMLKKRGKKGKGTSEEKTYRCDCFELIWPSRHHCSSCHRTFCSDVEFGAHNDGKCYIVLSSHEKSEATNGSLKAKGNFKSDQEEFTGEMDKVCTSKSRHSELGSRLIKFQNEQTECPYDFSEICSKFVTKDSNKELVQGIGLIGSNGIPSLVTSVSPYLSDTVLMLISPEKDISVCDKVDDAGSLIFTKGNRSESNAGLQSLSDNSAKEIASKEINEVLKTNKPLLECMKQRGRKSSSDKYIPEIGSGCCCVVPQSSLRPLVGKVSCILRQLKINLLDMEAALPEEALRPSKGQLEKRWAWRAYVKSAESIYQMVQATIVLEEMIKTEYLRNEWWYWSSLSAAAKTSTVSSLALRIYSLDASIVYEKTLSNSGPSENLRSCSISSQKPLPGLHSVEKCKAGRKSNKKRKEPEG